MNKSKIEWTDYSWNPIKGLCPVGCWYCYAKKMYKRFGWEDYDGNISPGDSKKMEGCDIFIYTTPSSTHLPNPDEDAGEHRQADAG